MWKYIVIWVLIKMVPIECPDYHPDQFGRMPTFHCAVGHYKIERDTLRKEFTDMKQAMDFYNEAKKESSLNIFDCGMQVIGIECTQTLPYTVQRVPLSTTGAWRIPDNSIITKEDLRRIFPRFNPPDTISMLSHNHF